MALGRPLRRWLLALLVATAALAGCASEESPPADSPPEPLRGITVDAVEDLDAVVDAVEQLDTKPTVRVVFDLAQEPGYYESAIAELGPHAHLMGLLVDSSELASITDDEMRQRADRFLETFGGRIAIWEIGNELNGAWVGEEPDQINAKVLAAYDVVRQHGGRTAITLNHWSSPDCYAHDWEATLTYAEHMPEELRQGVDYVFLSIYETACDPPQRPTARQIGETLGALGELFPDAALGIGEVGAQGISDGLDADPSLATRTRIAERYYGMHAELRATLGERFVGGYFWWYFAEDAVPADGPGSLWPTLNDLLSALG